MKLHPHQTPMKNLFIVAAFVMGLLASSVPLAAQDSTISTRSVYAYAGVPASGTNEIDTITIGGTPTAGSFTITVAGGRTTAAITWSATNATLLANIDAALEALSAVGTDGVTTAEGSLTAGIGTITLTFTGKNAKQNFPALSVTSSLTGSSPTLAIATTTAGVAATFPQAKTGDLLVDTSTPALYQNMSTTALSPTWSAVVSAELASLLAAVPVSAVADIGALTSAAITGGESPTEAEHNAVQADVATIRTKVNALLAALRTALIVTP